MKAILLSFINNMEICNLLKKSKEAKLRKL